MDEGTGRDDGAGAASSTHLQRAFGCFRRMHPNLAAPADLADWLNVSRECAYDYVKRLKELGCISKQGGNDARPLYGLTEEALAGIVAPPEDGRGRWVRSARAAFAGGRR